MAKKKWIQGAIKHPGALTQKAKAAGMSLAEFMRAPHRDTTTKHQIALARTLKRLGRRKKK